MENNCNQEQSSDYEREQTIAQKLGAVGRACITREAMIAHAAQYGIAWWMPDDDPTLVRELLAVCPLRWVPSRTVWGANR